MSEVYERVYQAVCTIPHGKVASYGQVARAIGVPRGARLVGWALRSLPPDTAVPWHRVINRQRWLSIVNPKVSASHQKDLLEAEGHQVTWDGKIFWVEGSDWYDFSEPENLLK